VGERKIMNHCVVSRKTLLEYEQIHQAERGKATSRAWDLGDFVGEFHSP
jgi:hypothetical protein